MHFDIFIDVVITKSQLADVLMELGAKIEHNTSDKWQNIMTELNGEEAIIGKFRLIE